MLDELMAATKKQRRPGGGWATVSTDSPPPNPQAKQLLCTVSGSKARFISADEDFAIWSATWEPIAGMKPEPMTIKGPLARVSPGEMLTCTGDWKSHPQHGWSFQVQGYRAALPMNDAGVAIWLEKRIDGVGPTFAKAIVAHFGAAKVFSTLDANPGKLRDVTTGTGRKLPEAKVEKAIEAWEEVKAVREIEAFLFSHGVTASLAAKLYRKYGAEVVTILQENPYQITVMLGVGFATADTVAKHLGITHEDPRRVVAGMLHVLDESARGDGHVFLSLKQLREKSAELLKVTDAKKIVEALNQLAAEGKVIAEDDEIYDQRIYLRRFHEMECRLARHSRELKEQTGVLFPAPVRPSAPDNATDEEVAKLMLPSDSQWGAVEMVRRSHLSMLIGGPGTGKTATTNTIVQIARKAKKVVKLCAPTGKAARRMAQLTGHDATTIHRLLEFSPQEGGFLRNEKNPIEADLIILDEASMLSLSLADKFFSAVPAGTHVLLVGDPNQLPPVECGKVLDDLIHSQTIPTVHLVEIFRQAAKSMIVQNARRINNGEEPFRRQSEAEEALGQKMLEDFFWITRADADQTREYVLDIVASRLPRTYGLNPIEDIMVLAPQHKGACGIDILNTELEKLLNRPKPGRAKKVVLAMKEIHVGSRIVQSRNDYTYDIMNGEIGIVIDYNDVDKMALLKLDDGAREIWVPVTDMETFHLAYALSVHRSQGSEFKCVVALVSWSHYMMLSRALTYTAVTRAQELCILVGETKALKKAVKQVDMKDRNSSLVARIHDASVSGELF